RLAVETRLVYCIRKMHQQNGKGNRCGIHWKADPVVLRFVLFRPDIGRLPIGISCRTPEAVVGLQTTVFTDAFGEGNSIVKPRTISVGDAAIIVGIYPREDCIPIVGSNGEVEPLSIVSALSSG